MEATLRGNQSTAMCRWCKSCIVLLGLEAQIIVSKESVSCMSRGLHCRWLLKSMLITAAVNGYCLPATVSFFVVLV